MRDFFAAHVGLLPAFDSAIASYDTETARHSTRVGIGAAALGRARGMSADELDWLQWAGILHDLGKLAVPGAILRKEGPLRDEEWEEMRRHPVVGAQLLRAISAELEPIAVAVESHHERWDGSGYPYGLAEQAIPLGGRMVAVADVFDSITHRRNYRPYVLEPAAAVRTLAGAAGSQLDPELVGLFIELFNLGQIPTT